MKEEVWVAGRDKDEALARAAQKLGADKTEVILHQGTTLDRGQSKAFTN